MKNLDRTQIMRSIDVKAARLQRNLDSGKLSLPRGYVVEVYFNDHERCVKAAVSLRGRDAARITKTYPIPTLTA